MITSSPSFQLGGRRDFVFVGQLQRIDHAQNFREVAAGAGRIRDHQTNFFVWINNIDGPNRKRIARVRMNCAVQVGNFAISVGEQRKIQRAALGFFDRLWSNLCDRPTDQR